MTEVLVCKEAGDDPNHRKRPATRPGPRCETCKRRRRRDVSAAAHARRLTSVYGITDEEYAALYELQGGRCYVCVRATGSTKRLAVEHDHGCTAGHPPDRGCRQCITGLACGPCNQDVLGRLGRNPATYDRIATTLRYPPAARLFGRSPR